MSNSSVEKLGKARRKRGSPFAIQPRDRGGSGSGPNVLPASRRTGSGSSKPGTCAFVSSGIAGDTTAGGSAQPILAMQSSVRSEEHTSELQSLMRISYAVFCLKKKKQQKIQNTHKITTNRTKSHL